MPIRVLHIVTYMGRGGLETMLMNYYRNIDRSKIQFDFLVHRDFIADYDQEILSMGGRIYRLPKLNPFSKKYLSCLDSFFAEHKEYHIVHSHLDCMAGIPLKYAKKHGVSARIAHAHSSNQTKDIKYVLKLVFKNNIHKYANNLFACGENAGKWMFNTDKFNILNNAIDAHKYSFNSETKNKIRKEFGIDTDALVIGHVGRFSAPKNHEYLINVFYELQKTNDNAVLMLVGDGELRSRIEQQVQKLNITEKVILTGIRADVYDLIQAMDVFVFPSIYEGLPVSIIEAQAAGLPCIISDKVPLECAITDSVYQLNLDDMGKWVDCIGMCARLPRFNRYEKICSAGYDIKQNARELENTYLHMLQKEDITV